MFKVDFNTDLSENAIKKQDAIFFYVSIALLFVTSIGTPILWWLNLGLLTYLIGATFVVVLIGMLLLKLRYGLAARDIFCFWGPCAIFLGDISDPGHPGILIYFVIMAMYPFVFFSMDKNFGRILFHCAFTLLAASCSAYNFVMGIRLVPLEPFPPFMTDFVLFVYGIFLSILIVFAFNYLNHKATKKIADQQRAQKDILDSINEGLFTVDKNRVVGQEYSRILSSILNIDDASGADFSNLVLAKSDLRPTLRSQIESVLELIGENAVNFEANAHFLPAKFNYDAKKLELNWSPVVNQGTLEKVMFVVRDITVVEELVEEISKQNQEISIITTCVKAGGSMAVEYVFSALESIREAAAKASEENIASTFVLLHTIKGNARIYGFTRIADIAHQAEDYFQRARVEKIFSSEGASTALRQVKDELAYHVAIIEKYLGAFLHHEPDQSKKRLRLQEVIQPIIENMPHICSQVGVEVPEVRISEAKEGWIDTSKAADFRNIFTHLINNAIAHGIEGRSERVAKGKSANGVISITVQENDSDDVKIIFKDDGRGLNLGALAKRGNSLPGKDDMTIAEEIFKSGVSTAKSVDLLAGRGVGLDAVREFISNMSGKIVVEFTGGLGKDQFRPFQFRIDITKAKK